MDTWRCPRCGGDKYTERDGFRICAYCRSRFRIEERLSDKTGISVNDDIQRLLRKCREDPQNADRYAGLILEIDPENPEARRILYGPPEKKGKSHWWN